MKKVDLFCGWVVVTISITKCITKCCISDA